MKLLVVKLTEAQLKGLDELIKTGIYQNKSTAIREAIRDLLNSELCRTSARATINGKQLAIEKV